MVLKAVDGEWRMDVMAVKKAALVDGGNLMV